jgi:hypothetical protein
MDPYLTCRFGNAKLSSWYCVGLLARDQDGDVERARKLLSNALTQQELDSTFEQNYGSYVYHPVIVTELIYPASERTWYILGRLVLSRFGLER